MEQDEWTWFTQKKWKIKKQSAVAWPGWDQISVIFVHPQKKTIAFLKDLVRYSLSCVP